MSEDSKDGEENLNLTIIEPVYKNLPKLLVFEQDGSKGELFLGSDGKFHFEGDLDASAKVFFDYLKQHLDTHLAEKLKNVEKAKELCRKYAKATEFYDEIIEGRFVKMTFTEKKFVNLIAQEILDVLENGKEQARTDSPEQHNGD